METETEHENVKVDPHKDRRHRRAEAAWVARQRRREARKRAAGSLSGAAAVDRWSRDAWAELVRQGAKRGIELETVQDRKRLIIALNREQAALAGVRPCTWATMTRAQRGRLIDAALAGRAA